MSSIFTKLLSLKLKTENEPLEDYFSELIAFLFDNVEGIFEEFCNYFDISHGIINKLNVHPQYKFDALEGHSSDSKPDIVIFSQNAVFAIESKINAVEGYKQLQRYAEQIDQFNKNGYLIYITRDYDPKDENEIMAECKNGIIKFKQIRWHQVFHFLKTYKNDFLISQILMFMNEHNLSSNNQFSPIDIITMSNFWQVKKIMDETMSGIVEKRFIEVAKDINQDSATMTQLRNWNRYDIFANQSHQFFINLGYSLKPFYENDYPDIRVMLDLGPKATMRGAIIEAFKDITSKNSNWTSDDLTESNGWVKLKYRRSLQEIIVNQDHVAEIKRFFLEALDSLENIKKDYPNLPWKK